MGLYPSNMISEEITGRAPFPNTAGLGETDPERVDAILRDELGQAGITICLRPEADRKAGGEPRSIVWGRLCGWTFTRAWYYWIAKGPPGIPVEDAEALHAKHGTSVRVDGHCGCPSPTEWCEGRPVELYHVDNQEGLNALAELIRDVVPQLVGKKIPKAERP
jgi:hypothetical protein